jgi:receptor protein-tyrosine kinase
MSLVERALKKLQQSGTVPESALPPGRVHGEGTLERSARAALPASVEAAASIPERHIERPSRIVKIDRERLRALQLLPPPSMERRISSEYRQIKRPLIDAALGRTDQVIERAQIIMLASALPGEGKTFTSINLALSMAREKDVEVILINGDVAKPHLDNLFGLEGEQGLLDLLADRNIHPDSVILTTDVSGLRILPAGRKTDSATELLASDRMKDLMAQLAAQDRRRIILVDSPPLLLSTESQALVTSVGQVVLIVRAEATSEGAVLAAIEATGGGKPISLILNQSTAAPGDGYYYGYGSYGDAVEAESK